MGNLHLTFVYSTKYIQTKVRWRFCKILWPSQNMYINFKYVARWGDCTFIPADWGLLQQICAMYALFEEFLM